MKVKDSTVYNDSGTTGSKKDSLRQSKTNGHIKNDKF